MKKLVLFMAFVSLCAVYFSVSAFAATATVETSKAENGIVTVKLEDFAGKTIKAQVEKGGGKYTYTLNMASVNLPLQMGAGDYKVTVLENVGGDKYKPIATQSLSVKTINETEMYKASVPMVEYSASKTAVPAFKTLATGKTGSKDKLDKIYADIVSNYSYDTAKASTVKGDYVPNIDSVYAAKKGICYDYAALLAGALRSQGVPTKLVMGYVPEISSYHAWNEVLINGVWVAVDATYDAQVVKAGKNYTMEKDKSKNKTVKQY